MVQLDITAIIKLDDDQMKALIAAIKAGKEPKKQRRKKVYTSKVG